MVGPARRPLASAIIPGMEPIKRVTDATLTVLDVLLAANEPIWGLRIIKESALLPGTVYPILERLSDLGWVVDHWDDDDARPGPRRRYYALTAEAGPAARRLLAERERRAAHVPTSLRARSA